MIKVPANSSELKRRPIRAVANAVYSATRTHLCRLPGRSLGVLWIEVGRDDGPRWTEGLAD
jgi:hypothetical protein